MSIPHASRGLWSEKLTTEAHGTGPRLGIVGLSSNDPVDICERLDLREQSVASPSWLIWPQEERRIAVQTLNVFKQ
jgi:hypothetical protein